MMLWSASTQAGGLLPRCKLKMLTADSTPPTHSNAPAQRYARALDRTRLLLRRQAGERARPEECAVPGRR
eukprot:11973310-Alexandrium_andersonii.AAC.1